MKDLIKIKVKNVKSQILSVFPAELVEHFSIYYENYWHMPKVQSGEWDGKYRFIDVKTGKFPTGLLEQVVDWFEKHDFECEIEDERVDPGNEFSIQDNILNGIVLRDYQMNAIKSALEKKRGILQLPTGSGKALPINTKIYTPNGVTTIGNLSIGDLVLTPSGKSTKVVGIYPQGKIPIYEIIFNNGDKIKCCKNHLWKIKSRINWGKDKFKIMSLKEIIIKYKNKSGRCVYQISPSAILNFNERKVKIHPYIMGALLGDGSFRQNMIRFSSADSEIIHKIESKLLNNYILKKDKSRKYDYYIAKLKNKRNKNYYVEALKFYKLFGLLSENKFIPDDYKYNNKKVRLSILQGLMDTDGYVHKKPKRGVEFSSSSKQLAYDVKEIVETLGGICRIREKTTQYTYQNQIKHGLINYTVTISGKLAKHLFQLYRKKIRIAVDNLVQSRIIKNIKFCGYDECVCISVDDNDKMYVIEHCIPTHNTEIAIGIVKALGLRTLYLVNTKDLLHQTRDRFNKRVRMDVGIIGDGEFLPGHDVNIATVQSLDSWMKAKKTSVDFKKFVNSHQCIILDECHHASATTFYRVVMYCHNAYYRLGLSGTPLDRADLQNMKLIACIGDRIYSLPTKDLQESGDLCDIEIRIIENKESFGSGRWQTIYKHGIVESEQRNKAILQVAKYHLNQGDNVLILVREIKHGKFIENKLKEIDIPVIFLQGITKSKYRKEVMQRFNEAGRFILVATTIFDEGVDLPEINVLIQAPGGKSDVKTIQRTGRGLRKKEDGGKLIVYDFADHSQYLLEHSIKRIETYQKVFGKDTLRYDAGRLIQGSQEPLESLFEGDE